MLPPLIVENAIEPILPENNPVEPAKPLRSSVDSSYKTLSSGLWMLGGVFASVFGGLLLIVLAVFSFHNSSDQIASYRVNAGADTGEVHGSWTRQYGSQQPSTTDLFNAATLQKELERIVSQHPKLKFSLVVAPVGEGSQARINDDAVMSGASTTKLLTAVAVLRKIDSGALTFESTAYELVKKAESSEESTQSAEVKDAEVKSEERQLVSVEQALRQMVNRSDNVAWEHLIKLVGSRNLRTFAAELGMQEYDVRNNDVSARDLALLLQKIYSGQLMSEASTKHLLSLMQKTNEERMLPAAFDRVGAVYHKYGWLGGFAHDVGIVDNHGKPVIVVVLSEGSDSLASRAAIIRDMAEVVEQALLRSNN